MSKSTQPNNSHKKSTPTWMKAFLGLVVLLASAQLLRDLGASGISLSTLGAGFQVLGQTTYADSVLGAGTSNLSDAIRLKEVQTSRDRCQNKLGLNYGYTTSGSRLTNEELWIHQYMMKTLYKSGMRYAMINAETNTRDDVLNVAELVELSYQNYLIPIVQIGTKSNGQWDSASTNAKFYEDILTVLGQEENNRGNMDLDDERGLDIIATMAPRYMMDDANYGQAKSVAESAAEELEDQHNIIAVPAVMRTYESPGSGTFNYEYPILGAKSDEVAAMNSAGLDLGKFDKILVGAQNSGEDFGVAKSINERRATFLFADSSDGMYIRAREWLQEFNDENGLNMRAIITDFGPTSGTEDINPTRLKERLMYDFGKFSDFPEVDGVVFSERVTELILDEVAFDDVEPPEEEEEEETEPLDECPVGENLASMAGAGAGAAGRLSELGYGSALVIINDGSPSSISAAISDAQALCNAGVTPVIRSCIVGTCGFNNGAEQATALNQIIEGAKGACSGGDPGMYVVCGHNEPMSEHPMSYDGIHNNENDMIALFKDEATTFAGQCVRDLNKPSWVGVTSPIFNGTQPLVSVAARTFKQNYPGSLSNDFACIASNVYSVPGKTAAEFYNEIMSQFSQPGCVMETGYITSPGPPATASSDPAEVTNIVRDLLAAGAINVMGFNFTGMNSGFSTFALDDAGESLVAAICGGQPIRGDDDRFKAIQDFFEDINLAGTNCNYDLVDFGQEYDEKATAAMCGIKDSNTSSKLARTKISCGGIDGVNVSCKAEVTFTLQAGLPIAGSASNSPVGERTYPYPSFAVQAAERGNDIQTDYLNQNAGRLVGDDFTYAMPWLGSMIDAIGEGTKSYFYNKPDSEQNLSEGASILQSRLENSEDRWGIWGYSHISDDEAELLPDEHTICIGNFCVKIQDYIEVADSFRVADPTKTSNYYERSRMCGEGARITKADPDNMIYGSEIELEVKTWQGTGPELCYEAWELDAEGETEAVREIEGTNINCRSVGNFVNKAEPTPDPELEGPNNPCRCNERLYEDNPDTPDINEEVFYAYNEFNVRSGICTADKDVINKCTEYVVGESLAATYEDSVAYIDFEWPEFPRLAIEGVYDALANLYKTVQDKMSALGLKLILPEGIGWRGEQTIRAYTRVESPEYKLESAGVRKNNMLENTFTSGTIPDEDIYRSTYDKYLTETAEVVEYFEDDIDVIEAPGINNERLDNVHTAYTYYEMLGYLDILNMIDNTFFTESLLPGGRLDEDGDYIEDLADNLLTQVPGCDGPIATRIGMPINCIAPYANPTSEKYKADPLGVFLCELGYDSGEQCETIPDPEDLMCMVEITGDVTCPLVGGRCTFGPFDPTSHTVLNAVDLSYGNVVVAPFDGVITRAETADDFSYCSIKDANGNRTRHGGAIWFTGNVGGQDMTIFMYHVLVDDAVLSRVGESYSAGEQITVISTPANDNVVRNGCWRGNHVHYEVATGPTSGVMNKSIDINGIFNSLGCGMDTGGPQCSTGGVSLEDVEAGEVSDLVCVDSEGNTSTPGVLSCEIDLEDTSDNVAWAQIRGFINQYVRAYNTDQDVYPSRTWIGHSSIEETPELRSSLEQHWGGASGADQEREERLRVTEEVISYAKSQGLNPRFVATLWIEETGASAVGARNMGCIYFRDGRETREVTLGMGPETMIDRLKEQIDCIRTYVDDFPDFTQFMCTYSGEVGRPDCTEFTNNPNFPRNVCKYYNNLGGNF